MQVSLEQQRARGWVQGALHHLNQHHQRLKIPSWHSADDVKSQFLDIGDFLEVFANTSLNKNLKFKIKDEKFEKNIKSNFTSLEQSSRPQMMFPDHP
jgi:hypothetical protein